MTRRSLAAFGLVTFLVLGRPHPATAQTMGQPSWPSTTTITVRPGDNVYRIALRYGATVEALMRANQLTSADRILVGQRLQVPLGGAAGAPTAVAVPVDGDVDVAGPADVVPRDTPPIADSPSGQYVVQPGDNLYRIALRNATSVNAIMAQNALSSPDVVYAGQVLRIPGGDAGAGVRDNAGADAGSGVGGAPVAPASPSGATVDASAEAAPSAPETSAPESSAPTTSSPVTPAPPPPAPAAAGRGWRTIVIDLSDQTLTAYESGATVRSFVVSTGKPSTPTPIGYYSIYSRYRSQDMSGPGYWAPGVPFVQYFIGGYALHGTYWHTAFGTPVSHGCVNLQTPDAEWLWGWATVGTPVTVQW